MDNCSTSNTVSNAAWFGAGEMALGKLLATQA